MNICYKTILIIIGCLTVVNGLANTEKFEQYLNKSNKLINTDIEISEQYLDSCKNLINIVNDKSLISDYYIASSKKDIRNGNFKQAIYVLERTINDLKHNNEVTKLANAQYLLATALQFQGEYSKSITLALQAKTFYESTNDTISLIKCSHLIGNLFYSLDQFDLAFTQYNIVETYAIAHKNNTLLLACQNNLANLYLYDSVPNYEMAIKYYTLAIKTAKKLNSNALYNMHTNLGWAYIGLNNLPKAKHFSMMALDETPDKNAYVLSKIYHNLSTIAERELNYKDARTYLKKSISESLKSNNKYELKDAYEKLANIEQITNNYIESINYLKLANKYNDSIYQLKQNEIISKNKLEESLKFKIENNKLESKIESLLTDQTRGYLYRKIGLTMFIILVTIIIILRRRYSKNQKKIIAHLKSVNETLNTKNHELDETIKTRDTLLSTIGHDIKNPLGTILGFTELLIHNYNNPEKSLLFSKQIHKSTSNLFMLLDNLVFWAKSQNQKIATNPMELNVDELIRNNIEIFAEMANAKNITLVNSCSTKHYLFADKQTLNTAIRNIINNAIKFTPTNGRIEICSELKHGQLLMHFQDSGVGINTKDIPLLFKANTDRDAIGKNSHQEKGTGLGLVLTNEFILLNNGKIEVASEENKGTCFTISLPVDISA